MWKRKSQVTDDMGADIRIVFPEAGLKVVFDECDRFDHDETGGRLVGTFAEHGGKLTIHVTGIIESGPQATRSRVSFFQDGAHQEVIFRQIESRHPEIEHLGNWHTHHVNGLPTLSGGDLETYYRTVNHQNHNTPFFYALLVTAKHRTSDPRRRYSIKHFVFRRGDKDFYEVLRGTSKSSIHRSCGQHRHYSPSIVIIPTPPVHRRGRTVPMTTTSSASFIPA